MAKTLSAARRIVGIRASMFGAALRGFLPRETIALTVELEGARIHGNAIGLSDEQIDKCLSLAQRIVEASPHLEAWHITRIAKDLMIRKAFDGEDYPDV